MLRRVAISSFGFWSFGFFSDFGYSGFGLWRYSGFALKSLHTLPFPLPLIPYHLMFERLSQRLLTLLQLSRMALVFTAIADSYATALIIRRVPGYCDAENKHDPLEAALMVSIAAISIGLYGFGMSLNDIADRRRDRQIASHRPLPSGRVGVFTAHAFMLFLVTGALAAAAYY